MSTPRIVAMVGIVVLIAIVLFALFSTGLNDPGPMGPNGAPANGGAAEGPMKTPPGGGGDAGSGPKADIPRSADPAAYLVWAAGSARLDLQLAAIEVAGVLDRSPSRQILDGALERDEDGEFSDEELAMRAVRMKARKAPDDELFKALVEALDLSDEDWDVETDAARAAKYFPQEDALRLLTTLANDDDEEVRIAAAVSLGRRDEAAADDALLGMVDDEEPGVSAVARGALVAREVDGALDLAREILEEDDEDLTALVALGLGQPGREAGIPLLVEIAKSEWEEPRIAAARAFGEIGTPAAADRLRPFLDDPEEAVRIAAAAALVHGHGDPRGADVLAAAIRIPQVDVDITIEATRALASLARAEDRALFEEAWARELGDEPRPSDLVLRAWLAYALLTSSR